MLEIFSLNWFVLRYYSHLLRTSDVVKDHLCPDIFFDTFAKEQRTFLKNSFAVFMHLTSSPCFPCSSRLRKSAPDVFGLVSVIHFVDINRSLTDLL